MSDILSNVKRIEICSEGKYHLFFRDEKLQYEPSIILSPLEDKIDSSWISFPVTSTDTNFDDLFELKPLKVKAYLRGFSHSDRLDVIKNLKISLDAVNKFSL